MLLTLALAGCAEDEASRPAGGGRPPVVVGVEGSPLLVPLMLQAARRYQTWQGNVK